VDETGNFVYSEMPSSFEIRIRVFILLLKRVLGRVWTNTLQRKDANHTDAQPESGQPEAPEARIDGGTG